MAIEIEVTPDSSFCPGVDRAFRITEKMLFGDAGQCYSVGPLIHNPEVVKRLEMLGLAVIDPDGEGLADIAGRTVVIRSHGIDTETENRLLELGAVLVDATCPTVKRAQDAARGLLESGHSVLVVGSASHPEVRSIVGRAGGSVTVIQDAGEAREWAARNAGIDSPIGVVCQTTIPRARLDSVLEELGRTFSDITVRDTICESVARRQDEARDLAGRVDVMIVAGGRDSSNTAQLAATCESTGVPTHLIEDASEIEPDWLEGAGRVGVTGGASTPDWLIQEAIDRLQELDPT
ncbi:MAG: 4-hydroxy-3-methylbut-2-enyl diphosphate reductase [Candidatus Geothermincolia bacterium]